MARTRAFAVLRRSLRLALAAQRSGLSAAEQIERARAAAFRPTRRELLRAGAATTAAALLPWKTACSSGDAGSDARVAVVGAGMAGLLCAYRLQQGGVRAEVFDANTRVGGRMFTARGMLAGGQLAELGGEFIDTGHATLRGLAEELDIALDDLLDEPEDIRRDTWFFQGRVVPDEEIVTAFMPLAEQMQAALAMADESDEAFEQLDQTSIEEWLDAQDELDPVLRSLLTIAYVGEYGREASEQSLFNLLLLIDSETPDPFRIYGDSDERFHAHDGNDTFPSRLAERLDGQIELERRLVSARALDSGAIRLALDRDGTAIERDFDKVVLALPWTLLREVELDLELPSEKRQMIDELGYGTNAKVIGQFATPVWRDESMATGSATSDNGVQTLWDSARKQRGEQGLMTVFLGGEAGEAAGEGSAEERMAEHLPGIDEIFPGSADAYRQDSALRMHWPSAPLFRGSYACFLPGQAVWSGTEGEPAGNVHFCGEHTSEEFQGYMEGAAETGERAAEEVLAALGMTPGNEEPIQRYAVATGGRLPRARRRGR
jgi:monoamine oxidase